MPRLALLIVLASAVAAVEVGGAIGAVSIPFTMPYDGQATVMLLSAQGRVVRPLAQVLAAPKGPCSVRWDGMDLWGNPVAAGTALVVKVVTNPGLKAVYEFCAATSAHTPWPSKSVGEGLAMRAGGWLGDHSTPADVAVAGDRLFVSATMAEHGNTLIATDLDGNKLWGRGGFKGWVGPRLLAIADNVVYGLVDKTRIYRMSTDYGEATVLCDTAPDVVRAMAVHAGKLHLVLDNAEAGRSGMTPEISSKSFNLAACVPAPGKGAGSDKVLSEAERFTTVFADGAWPETGVKATPRGAVAVVVAAFVAPVTVGTLLLERMPGVGRAEVFVLRPGVGYAAVHAPGADGALGPDWQPFASSDLAARVTVLTAPSANLTTAALCLRLHPAGNVPEAKWAPLVGMCRLLPARLRRVDDGAVFSAPQDAQDASAEVKDPPRRPGDRAWALRATAPISEVAPLSVMIDFAQARPVNGACVLNCTSTAFALDFWQGAAGSTPDAAASDGWVEVATHETRYNKYRGHPSAAMHANDVLLSLKAPVSTRALRLRVTAGYGNGRGRGMLADDDALFCAGSDLIALALVDPPKAVPERIVQVRDAASGEKRQEFRDPSIDIEDLCFAEDGTCFAIAGTRLCRTTFDGAVPRHQVLADKLFSKPIAIAATTAQGGRIVVGDDGRDAVFILDLTGAEVGRIGNGGPRRRGPWDPRSVDLPTGVAIDRNGRIWVAEGVFTPKRVSRYAPDGSFEKAFYGPPHYGGGGYLDPSLTSFFYEACEFTLDWTAGTSRLVNLNDVQSDPLTPTLEPGSYTYTKVGRPVHLNGRRYAVGDPGWQQSGQGFVVSLFAGGGVWKPCAVMATAQASPFLLKKPHWRAHWLAKDLNDASFIWCDRNGDGQYQIEEVDLFRDSEVGGKPPFAADYWGNRSGADLTVWTANCRLKPARISEHGVPIYERKDLQPFAFAALSPTYPNLMTVGAAAKKGVGGATIVMPSGNLLREGQPVVVRPDLTLKGGGGASPPSDFVPPVLGVVMNCPLSFVGAASTTGAVSEVAVMNGDNGHWYVVSGDDGVVIGTFFTGRDGGWGGLPNQRGMDVTQRKHDWETFFGDFIRAQDGNCYTVAGKGFHGICRIEGLDAYQAQESTLTVSAAAFTANQALRPQVIAAAKAAKARTKKPDLALRPLATRAKGFAADGDLTEWGDAKKFAVVGEAAENLRVDAAYDAQRLHLAYAGTSVTANSGEDFRFLFKTGFAFDVMVRSDPKAQGDQPQAGDRRVVFAALKGQWTAVLYDYVDAKVPADQWVAFASPIVTTSIARVERLPASAYTVAFRELPGAAVAGRKAWSAEATLTWAALGLVAPQPKQTLRMDFGILSADTGGTSVDRRAYWSNPDTLMVADLGVEARLQPGNWGTVVIQ